MVSAEQISCISIIVCNDIYRDEATKNLIIVGTFNSVISPKFPYVHPSMHVLLSLTNGNGEYVLSLSIEHADTGANIAQISGPFEIRDPLAISDVNIQIRNVKFPKPGKYGVKLEADSVLLVQRPVMAALIEQEETSDDR